MMNWVLLFAILIEILTGLNYPVFKQCDDKWRNEKLGTSTVNTICSAGCLLSSTAMALAGTGHNYNPSTLNVWLKQNNGYVSTDLFVWSSLNKIGFNWLGKQNNNQIKKNLDLGYIVICNVHNGQHWVLAYGYNGDNILVNDPGFNVNSYSLSQIVQGQNGIYSRTSYLQKVKQQ